MTFCSRKGCDVPYMSVLLCGDMYANGGAKMSGQIDAARQVIRQFCLEFTTDPYLCYTEHGQHALFYTMLYNALPVDQRFTTWQGHKVCVIQKEYRTAESLGASRRQNWDIALIKTPPESIAKDAALSYDYLKLAAVVEFGMNVEEEHLRRDIERLCHPDANLEQGFIIHLYRLSERGAEVSNRDKPPDWREILSREHVAEMGAREPVEIFYGLYDATGRNESGLWLIKEGKVTSSKRLPEGYDLMQKPGNQQSKDF